MDGPSILLNHFFFFFLLLLLLLLLLLFFFFLLILDNLIFSSVHLNVCRCGHATFAHGLATVFAVCCALSAAFLDAHTTAQRRRVDDDFVACTAKDVDLAAWMNGLFVATFAQ
jgi:hypothetical protein